MFSIRESFYTVLGDFGHIPQNSQVILMVGSMREYEYSLLLNSAVHPEKIIIWMTPLALGFLQGHTE